MFEDRNSNEFDAATIDLMEKNGALTEEVKNLKREQEVQSLFLFEITEMKKKAEEDKVMIEEDKRILTNRLEEKTSYVQNTSNMQLDTMNQLILANHELNGNNIEFTTLKSHNALVQNELRAEKQFSKRFKKPSEVIKYFEKLMESPRPNNDTAGLE